MRTSSSLPLEFTAARYSGVMVPARLLPDGDHQPPATGAPPAPVPAPPSPAPAPAAPPAPAPLGFPADTPVSEMTPEQQAAYWRNQSRTHQRLWEQAQGPEHRETVRKAAEFDRLQREQLPAQERAIADAREAALAEGRATATTEANRASVKALLSMALQTKGKTADDAAALTKHLNFDSFVTDGKPDEAAILAHVTSMTGPGTGTGGKGPDFGQGQRQATGGTASTAAGADIWAKRHPRTATA